MKKIIAALNAAFSSSAFLSLVRIGGAGAGFLAHVTMAWMLSPAELGIFYAATSLVAVAAIVTAQGYPQIAARFVTRYQEQPSQSLLTAFVSRAVSNSMKAALVVTVIIVIAVLYYPGLERQVRVTTIICAIMLPAATLLNVFTNLAGAKLHFGICYVPEGLFKPALFFLVIGGISLAGVRFSSSEAALVNSVITFGVAIYVYHGVSRFLPRWTWQPPTGRLVAKRWRREAWPLILLSLFTNFFVDVAIICASPFLTKSEIAVFGFCLKLALLVGYIVQIAQQMAAPQLAVARRNRSMATFDHILSRAILMPAGVTGAATIAVFLFGGQLLGLLGESFKIGHQALVVLVAAQFLRSLAGPSVHLITLTGSQYVNSALSAAAVVVLMLGYGVLVPAFGLSGAAGAVLIAYAFWLAAMAVTLRWLGEAQTDALSVLWRTTLASQRPALATSARK